MTAGVESQWLGKHVSANADENGGIHGDSDVPGCDAYEGCGENLIKETLHLILAGVERP